MPRRNAYARPSARKIRYGTRYVTHNTTNSEDHRISAIPIYTGAAAAAERARLAAVAELLRNYELAWRERKMREGVPRQLITEAERVKAERRARRPASKSSRFIDDIPATEVTSTGRPVSRSSRFIDEMPATDVSSGEGTPF